MEDLKNGDVSVAVRSLPTALQPEPQQPSQPQQQQQQQPQLLQPKPTTPGLGLGSLTNQQDCDGGGVVGVETDGAQRGRHGHGEPFCIDMSSHKVSMAGETLPQPSPTETEDGSVATSGSAEIPPPSSSSPRPISTDLEQTAGEGMQAPIPMARQQAPEPIATSEPLNAIIEEGGISNSQGAATAPATAVAGSSPSVADQQTQTHSQPQPQTYFFSRVKSKLKKSFTSHAGSGSNGTSYSKTSRTPLPTQASAVSQSAPTTPAQEERQLPSSSSRASSIFAAPGGDTSTTSLSSTLTTPAGSRRPAGTYFSNRSISSLTSSLRTFTLRPGGPLTELRLLRRAKTIDVAGPSTGAASSSSSRSGLHSLFRRSSSSLRKDGNMPSTSSSSTIIRTYPAIPNPTPYLHDPLAHPPKKRKNVLRKPRPPPPTPDPSVPPPLLKLGFLPYPTLRVQTTTQYSPPISLPPPVLAHGFTNPFLASNSQQPPPPTIQLPLSFTIEITLLHPGQKVEYMMDNTTGRLLAWVYAPHRGFEGGVYSVVSLDPGGGDGGGGGGGGGGGDGRSSSPNYGHGLHVPAEFDWNGLRVRDWGGVSGKYVFWFPRWDRGGGGGGVQGNHDGSGGVEGIVAGESTIAPPETTTLEVGDVHLTEADLERTVLREGGWGSGCGSGGEAAGGPTGGGKGEDKVRDRKGKGKENAKGKGKEKEKSMGFKIF
ncbi:hypothetical protein DFH27DRAFT_525402 [Peziza echinospora]|nr:hypothetical protein DFH27DRAFT_525402 [Peziza echinospora]